MDKKEIVKEYIKECEKKGKKVSPITNKFIETHNFEEIKEYIDNNQNLDVQKKENKNKNVKETGFGFSYIVIYKVVTVLLSLILSIFVAMFFTNMKEQISGILAIIITIVTFGVSYYTLSFFIVIFENISIIARNTSILVNKLDKDKEA